MSSNMHLSIIDGVLQSVSTISKQFDFDSAIILGVMGAIFIIVSLGFLFVWLKYNHKRVKNEDIGSFSHHNTVEFLWTVIPLIIVLILFYFGTRSLYLVKNVPSDSMNINVTAYKWAWKFKYPNGKESTTMYAPVDRNIKLTLQAPINDVLHAIFIPAFRIKQDIEPGKKTYTWFNSRRKGVYPIECAEYCGAGHSLMVNKVVVVSKEDFAKWLNEKKTIDESDPVAYGAKLFKTDCGSCHSINGSSSVGPTMKGLFGSTIKATTAGVAKEYTVDEAYLLRSIKQPNTDIPDGFSPNIMPSFSNLKGKEVNALIAYIKSLK